MPRGGVKKPIGYETIWKDREGRIRIKVKVAEGKRFVDKRIVEYLKYHPGEDLKGYVIIHLDNDPFNFSKDNLAKVKKNTFLKMLNNKIYFEHKELNKTSMLLVENINKTKEVEKNVQIKNNAR